MDLPTLLATTLVGVVASGLAVAVRLAFQRLREAEARQAEICARLVTVEGRPAGIGAEQLRTLSAELRECMAERYVRRDDYVTHIAGVSSRLDAQGGMLLEQRATLARVEERIRSMEGGGVVSERDSADLVMLESARWEILRCAYYGAPLGTTERMILPHLQMHWPQVDRTWLRRELDYLKRGGWIDVERHPVHDWRAHLTAPGRDLVDYTAPAPAGIRRPEKYWT